MTDIFWADLYSIGTDRWCQHRSKNVGLLLVSDWWERGNNAFYHFQTNHSVAQQYGSSAHRSAINKSKIRILKGMIWT